MSRDRNVYISVAKGRQYKRPRCFRCGDCCTYIPIEIQKERAELIARHLGGRKGEEFLNSITADWETANILLNQNLTPLTSGMGWIIAPCMFLKMKMKEGRERAVCEIYHIRPRICRTFYCGKDSHNEELDVNKYTYKRKESQLENWRQERLAQTGLGRKNPKAKK